MRRLFSLIVFAVMLCAPLPGAHAQKAHVPYYKQYNEAIATGDFATAADAGQRAWRAAETELGDQQTTAILAYNYAALIYFTTPEKAIEPLERVVALTGESNELFGAEPPGLMLSYARATAKDENRRLKTDLRRSLEALDKNSDELTLLSARGWLHIARYDMSRTRYSTADDAATASLRHYEAFREFVPREYVNVLMARGISKVAGSTRDNEDLIDANIDFTEAIKSFPPQRDIDSFDPLLAAAVAWNAAVRAAAASDNPGRPRLGSRFSRNPPKLEGIAYVKWVTPNPPYEICQFEWANRDAPKFPASASIRGYLGAVLIGYHIDGTRIADARILGEVPQRSEFGETTLSAMEEWELEEQPADPNCRVNRLLTVYFQLAN